MLMKAENLGVGYNSREVCSGISFSLEKGDFLIIVGENGAGKSTLMKTLLGFIPKLEGELQINADTLGYLPQQSEIEGDFPALVWDIVLSGNILRIKNRPFYRKEDKERTLKNLERLGISNLKKSCFRELSGGQKQRVLLARALCASEELLMLDEPVAGLDQIVRDDFYSLVRGLHKCGSTVVMVTHNIETLLDDATHVLHLGNEKKFFGKISDYPYTEFWKNN